jgi:hypothetical protein
MLGIAMLAVAPHLGGWMAVLAVGAAMAAAVWPGQRTAILFAATWAMAFLATSLGEVDTLERIAYVMEQDHVLHPPSAMLATGCLLVFAVAACGALHWVAHAPRSMLARRPMVTLLTLEAVLCGLGSLDLMQGPARVAVWSAIFVLTPYLWFLPYAIVDARSPARSPLLLQLAVLRPFWSPSYLPFGKGAAFLRRHLAQDPGALAVTQLKAVKLLVWANVLCAIRAGLGWLFEKQMHIPSVAQAVDAFLGGEPHSRLVSWAALVLSTAKFSLQTAEWAGLFVGIARLAGYRLPRGSWRPLGSRTLMDYFNRFSYYFKELLVDFFFVPTFLKVFRNHPRLRMFFATFMAAGVGNAIWHFVRDIDLVATHGLIPALETYTSYVFYCVVLATGVGLSQVRAGMGIRPVSTPLGRVYSFLFVWSFVVCMHLFSDGSRDHTLIERLSFLASLLGVS